MLARRRTHAHVYARTHARTELGQIHKFNSDSESLCKIPLQSRSQLRTSDYGYIIILKTHQNDESAWYINVSGHFSSSAELEKLGNDPPQVILQTALCSNIVTVQLS